MENNQFELDKTVAEAENADGTANIDRSHVSPAVIKRLPRYFRYLRELIRRGKTRVSSGELSEIMNVTASQIRQDLNCFGGFGQQGYGYNVSYLYARICEILGVSRGFTAVIIGAGSLGSALVRSPMFEKRGVEIVAMFDVSPRLIGSNIGGTMVYSMESFPEYCAAHRIDFAVLTVNKEAAADVAGQISEAGIRGIWNFTGYELGETDAVVENVHIGDSLMTLTYRLCGGERSGNGN